MNKSILGYCTLLSLALLMLVSCSKDSSDVLEDTQANPIYKGKVVPLNLSATLLEDEFRANVYDYDNKLELEEGKMPKLHLEKTVNVAVYVRKKGEEAQTVSGVILPGNVTEENGRYKIDIKGNIRLREQNHSLADGTWEVLCIIGGRSEKALPSDDSEDQPTSFKHMIYSTKEWSPTVNAGDTGEVFAWQNGSTALTMMPWMTEWNDLEGKENAPDTNLPVDGGYGSNMNLHFSPKGILFKIRLRSDVSRDVQISRLELRDQSQTLVWGGHFDLGSKSNYSNSRFPTFTKSSRIGVALKLNPQEINIQGAKVPYTLKSGEEMQESFYVWAMPKDPSAKTGQHRIQVTIRGGRSESREKNLFTSSRYTEIVKMPDFPDFYNFARGRAANDKESRSRNNGPYERQNYYVQSVLHMSVDRLGQGFTYELKPILAPTHPIILTEVLLRPNVANTNHLTNPEMSTYTSTWGGVELYNTSATPIDLSKYAIARITTPHKGNLIRATSHVAHPMSNNGWPSGPWNYSMNKALLQKLNFVPGEGSVLVDGTPMPDYKSSILMIYGNDPTTNGRKPILDPGKTAVFLDASYVRYNITDPSNINIDDIGGIGIQLQEAFNRGYTQFVVAMDNAKVKSNQQSWDDSEGPVLYGGILDSYALYKKNANNDSYSLVEYLGGIPTNALGTEGTMLVSFPGMMYTTKYSRDGNSRTRFSVLVDRINNGNDYDLASSWASASSLENDRTGDFVNHFMTFGSHEWLGPTEKSRKAEWAGVDNFDADKAKRKWTLAKP